MKNPDSLRPSVRLEQHGANGQVTPRALPGKDNDSLRLPLHVSAPPRRLSARSLERTRKTLSPRDLAIVHVFGTVPLRWVAARQMQRLHFHDGTAASNARRTQATLRRLTQLGLLHRLDRRIGGFASGSSDHVYCLGPVGGALVARSAGDSRKRRMWLPSPAFIRHSLAITELYVRLTEAHRSGDLELIEFQTEPLCWREFAGAIGRITIKPDCFIRIGRIGDGEYEDLWFIEVDCATESATALLTKFRTYRQYWASGREQDKLGAFPRVLWLAPTLRRVGQLIDVAAKQPAESWDLFGVGLFDEAIARLAKGAPS